MIQIPIGDIFESFIKWLKASAEGLFDLIKEVLDFAIQSLENILMLEPGNVYPFLVLMLIVGLLGYELFRHKGRNAGIGLGLAAAVIAGVVGFYYRASMNSAIDPEGAGEVIAKLERVQDTLEAGAPEEFDRARGVLEAVEAGLPDDISRSLEVALANYRNEVDDLRGGDYEDAWEELIDLRDALNDSAADPGDEAWEQLDSAQAFYLALSAIDEFDGVIRTLGRVDSAEPAVEILNTRSYDETMRMLNAAEGKASELGGSDAIVEATREAQTAMRSLDPRRLSWFPWTIMIAVFAYMAWRVSGGGLAAFTAVGFLLVVSMGFWYETMETLALVLSATLFALITGIPLGIWAARSDVANKVIRPVLDFMQTMPAFVYLIPAVIFFGLGKVPGAMATLIFAMPPAVRLTSLGIRQVPVEVVEACLAFGSTPRQLLFKAQLPIAKPTILAGVNQTIMLALSMVVIGGMIGAGGLGEVVLRGITQVKIGLGFEGGIAVVILAIFLDRITQTFGAGKAQK